MFTFINLCLHCCADVCRFFGSCTMPPGYSLVPTVGYHPPPGISGLLRWAAIQTQELQSTDTNTAWFELLSWQSVITAAPTCNTSWLEPPPTRLSNKCKIQFCAGARERRAGSGWGEVSLRESHQSLYAQKSGHGSGDKQGKPMMGTREAGDLGSCWERKAGRGDWDFWGGLWKGLEMSLWILSSFPVVPGMGHFMSS